MGTRLYLSNLPYSTTEADIRAFFEPVCAIFRVQILVDKETAKPRGVGFCSCLNEEEAALAIEKLNGCNLGGRDIVVKEARETLNTRSLKANI